MLLLASLASGSGLASMTEWAKCPLDRVVFPLGAVRQQHVVNYYPENLNKGARYLPFPSTPITRRGVTRFIALTPAPTSAREHRFLLSDLPDGIV